MSDRVFIRACRRQSVPYTPIWIMRQAGRYMKEYRAVRDNVSFLELCASPELSSKVTLDAAHMLDVDTAIIFADILLLADPLGLDLKFVKGDGPSISNPFRVAADLQRLKQDSPRKNLAYVGKAIELTRKSLDDKKSLIGFAGAPFTVASYFIEGGSSRNFENTRVLMKNDPQTFSLFLDKISQMTFEYLSMQIEAGADALQLFDSWVGILSKKEYKSHVFSHLKSLIDKLHKAYPHVPLIYFGTNTDHLLETFSEFGPDVIGVDSKVDIKEAAQKLGNHAIQGNMDPTTLLCSKEVIEQEALEILKSMKGRPGHIFNLGHGILPPTNFEHAKHLVEIVHAFK